MAFTYTLSPLTGAEFGTGERSASRTEGNTRFESLVYKISFDGTQTNADVIPLGLVYGNDIFLNGGYGNDALTGLTDIDIGLYTLEGVAVDADFFVDGDSLASAQATRFGDNAMSATNVSDIVDSTTMLGDLAATLSTSEVYVLAATINAAGSASGDFVLKYDVLRQN